MYLVIKAADTGAVSQDFTHDRELPLVKPNADSVVRAVAHVRGPSRFWERLVVGKERNLRIIGALFERGVGILGTAMQVHPQL